MNSLCCEDGVCNVSVTSDDFLVVQTLTTCMYYSHNSPDILQRNASLFSPRHYLYQTPYKAT